MILIVAVAQAALNAALLPDVHVGDGHPAIRSCQVRPPPRPPRLRRRQYRGMPRLGPGSLRAHEEFLGHCCRAHIGRTPEQLRTRLRRDPDLPIASTFYNMRNAQISLRTALRRNSTRINNWLNTGGYGNFRITVRMPSPIGIYLVRGARRVRKGRTATFLLAYTDYMPGGFFVVTGMVSR